MRSPDTTPDIRGFPIRRSTDQSSFTSSPWLIAGYNVLHRLLVPRHPPIALSSLSNQNKTKTTKMLASTVKFSRNKRPPTPTPTNSRDRRRPAKKTNHQKWPNPQNPTTCSNQPHPQTPTFHTRPKDPAVLTTPRNREDIRSMFHKPEPAGPETQVLATDMTTQPEDRMIDGSLERR